MNVHRLSRSKYAESLDGRGAELAGGRWNSKGIPVVYTTEHISLCMAGAAVHLPLGILPADYNLVTLEIPDEEIHTLAKDVLPDGWRSIFTIDGTRKSAIAFLPKGISWY